FDASREQPGGGVIRRESARVLQGFEGRLPVAPLNELQRGVVLGAGTVGLDALIAGPADQRPEGEQPREKEPRVLSLPGRQFCPDRAQGEDLARGASGVPVSSPDLVAEATRTNHRWQRLSTK